MNDEKILSKIKSVYQTDHIVPRPSGKVGRYLTWYGYYNEGGRRRPIYLGRELPERFRHLIPKVITRPGGGRRRDPGAAQAAGL